MYALILVNGYDYYRPTNMAFCSLDGHYTGLHNYKTDNLDSVRLVKNELELYNPEGIYKIIKVEEVE